MFLMFNLCSTCSCSFQYEPFKYKINSHRCEEMEEPIPVQLGRWLDLVEIQPPQPPAKLGFELCSLFIRNTFIFNKVVISLLLFLFLLILLLFLLLLRLFLLLLFLLIFFLSSSFYSSYLFIQVRSSGRTDKRKKLYLEGSSSLKNSKQHTQYLYCILGQTDGLI